MLFYDWRKCMMNVLVPQDISSAIILIDTWLLISKHKKVQTNAYLIWHGQTVCTFSGESLLSSHKTTLNRQTVKNDEK